MTRQCEECGGQIPAARLKIVPEAELCVPCQRAAEKEGRFQRTRMGHHIEFGGDEVESVESYLVRGGL